MAKKFSSDAERKAAMANMNNGSKGTNSNDIEKNIPLPSDNGNEENKMLRDEDPEPIIETELSDIFGDVEIDGSKSKEIDDEKLEKVVKESVIEILQRENRLDRDEDVEITFVTVRDEEDGDSGFYQYDFQIFKDREKTSLGGTAFGTISNGTVLDMELELFDESNDLTEKIFEFWRSQQGSKSFIDKATDNEIGHLEKQIEKSREGEDIDLGDEFADSSNEIAKEVLRDYEGIEKLSDVQKENLQVSLGVRINEALDRMV